MFRKKNINVLLVLFAVTLVFGGCSKKADEAKPLSEVSAEAEGMSSAKLKSMAVSYKDALTAKKSEIEKIAAAIKKIPIAEVIGGEAKNLKAELGELSNSVSALNERFQIYYQKLKEKGGDLTGL